jgi:ABC-2 type transport system ATP-binding protein
LKNSLEGDILTIDVDNAKKIQDKIKSLDDVKKVIAVGNIINITVKNAEKFAPEILEFARKNGVVVNSLSIRKPTLGDVFLHFTGREIREEGAATGEGFKRIARMRS